MTKLRAFFNRFGTYFLLVFCLFEAGYIGYKIPHPVDPPFVDPLLKSYLDDFQSDASRYGVEVNPEMLGLVQFADMPDRFVGFCNGPGKEWNELGFVHISTVSISNAIKDQVGSCYFKAIVYHELGHCLLYKDHDEENSLTIMDPTPYGSEDFWCKTWDDQVKDLFTREGTVPGPNFQMEFIPECTGDCTTSPSPLMP